jgi:integrase
VVRHRTVSLTIYPWRHPSGREYWRFKVEGRATTCASLEDAKVKARKICEQTFLGQHRIPELTPLQAARLRRLLDADPSLALVDEFLVWHGRRKPLKPLAEARAEFLAAKKAAAGASPHNLSTLAGHLSRLPDVNLGDVTPATLPALSGSPRTRENRRRAWVTFFRWCQKMEYLPHGEPTAPERLDRPVLARAIPSTYSPAELRVLLSNVRKQYLPWLVLAAFAGIRTEEICPQQGSKKSPLMWEDFQWDRGLIILRPETAKTGHRRVIPINDAIRHWLPDPPAAGRVGPHVHPSKPSTAGAQAETTRLGAMVGGWRRNALRHSFISYRAAQVGLAQTASEAGNSESEARRSYNDAKGRDEADEWFAVRNVPQMFPSESELNEP